MNTWVILVEMAVFAAIFTTVIFAYYRGNRKYSPASIHNYPTDIQAEYFKTHERVDVSYKSGRPFGRLSEDHFDRRAAHDPILADLKGAYRTSYFKSILHRPS